MAIIEHNYNISIRDIDRNVELSNKAILGFLEDIGGYHSNMVGYGLKTIKETKISWVLLHWKLKILKKIKYSDYITVKTWSRGSVRASCFRDFEIYNEQGELCAIASSKWTIIHLEKGLIRLSNDILDKYESEENCVFDSFNFDKLNEPETYSSVFEYTVQRRDIDINNHMHNLCYLDLAYEALPKEVYENTSFDNIEIMYKSGALLEETIKCFYSYSDDGDGCHYITIKSADENTLHAIVKLS